MLKVYNYDDDKLSTESTVVEGIETTQISPLVDYPEMNIVFQGGIDAVIGIDKTYFNVVSKFYVKGKVSKMCITNDRTMLIVFADKNLFKFELKKIGYEKYEFEGNGSVKSLAMTSKESDHCYIYIKNDLKKLNVNTNELSETIASLPDSSYDKTADPDDKYIFNIDTKDKFHRIDLKTGEVKSITKGFENSKLLYNVKSFKSKTYPNSLVSTC